MDIYTENKIEKALRLHVRYVGKLSEGRYLKIMDRLASRYTGVPSVKVSKLLGDYFEAVGVSTLDEALSRLRKIDNIERHECERG